jgi:hypothetical protein
VTRLASGDIAGTQPILNNLAPQVLQVPSVAVRPFFRVIRRGSFISFFPQHLTQYASMITPLFSGNRSHFIKNNRSVLASRPAGRPGLPFRWERGREVPPDLSQSL